MANLPLPPEIISIHGRIGNYVCYNAYGIQYVRSYTIPNNPKTEKQQKIRVTFGEVSKLWKPLPEEEKSMYNSLAEGKPLSGYNLFMSMTLEGTKPESISPVQSIQIKRSSIHASYTLRGSSVYASAKVNKSYNQLFNRVIIVKKPPGRPSIAA